MTSEMLEGYIDVVRNYHAKRKAAERGLDALCSGDAVSGNNIDIADELEFAYIDTVDLLFCGDDAQKSGWLYWFIYENDFGQKGLKAKFNGKSRKIKTVKDLWTILK